MLFTDLLTIGKIYLISLVLQLIFWPATKAVFYRLTDKGWPLSRLATSLFACLIVWQTAHFGLDTNTNFSFTLILLLSAIISIGWRIWGHREKLSREAIKMIAIEEYLFLVGLLGISVIRGFLPKIEGLEKFMDFGFINRYLVSPTLPAEDMWQAGMPINYYSFGHFWASGMIRIFLVSPAVGYNLFLGYIAGLTLSISFSISHQISNTKNTLAGLFGGLIGALMTTLAGNSHTIWYLIKNKSLTNYWYADATRFIHNTIHEFPGYSFVVADLHGHLLGLPIVLGFILTFLVWFKNRETVTEVIMGILLGLMLMTNTWDFAIYGLLLSVTGVLILINNKNDFWKLVRSACIMGSVAWLTALPWAVSFVPISSGIKMVTERSPLWQLGVLWTGGGLSLMMLWLASTKDESKLAVRAMMITVILLVIIPELVYAKDIYPNHPRANTMFKLTYQASVMIGLLSGALWAKLIDSKKIKTVWRVSGTILAGVILMGAMIFPTEGFPNFYQNFEKYQGLDGEKWLASELPEKYGVINYLRNNRDGRNMVEAVGDSYTHFNAVSVFSSTPTIEGWRVHEWLWRGGYDSVAVREAEVKLFYETSDNKAREELVKKYNIGWVLVGDDENGMYKVDAEAIQKLGKIVYQSGETYLVKVVDEEL